ncbi:GTP-binding protein YsxC [Novipirellula aureliae]|uniref:GTP-binding protein YsxC n=1 Tax=Novipirellula aureliae TaxID=2527966 RepID=A0A5C6EC96_9BACT|nr:dynamin family protein [Novipirellula aureliae]TWU45557.1 GTP-binding protein YsxC [Novipirellula aureliae]
MERLKSSLVDVRLRMVVLFLLWTLPVLCYIVIGLIAIYQTGWMKWVLISLPIAWTSAWIIRRMWPAAKLSQTGHTVPLTAPDFWTPIDASAIELVEQFRSEVDDVNSKTITDGWRFIEDAKVLAQRLANHYHADTGGNLVHQLTLVEMLAVIHLATEDLETWVLSNVPGGNIATMGQLKQVPGVVNKIELAQKIIYFGSAVLNPAKLAAYPLWRKSGQVVVELQDELVRRFYQRYLRQVGYYLIEMYSGRLKAGSQQYRQRFAEMATAVHAARGDARPLELLQDLETTIAVMGQVKAGKSSLINALTGDATAKTSVLPETQNVARYQFRLPDSDNNLILLDTPGYSEADVTRKQRSEIRTAVEKADIVLLVMAANSPARDADVKMLKTLSDYYQTKRQLRPPTIIGVLTHIDLLRPVREWQPPYDWRNPHELKEESMAAAVAYCQELFGSTVSDYACVYTGDVHPLENQVVDEVVGTLLAHLQQGKSAAVLKAFYKQLSEKRVSELTKQVIGLLKSALS